VSFHSFAVRSLEQTFQLASAVAVLLQPGDVVLLNGELGAGKTAFVQSLARSLGIEETVTSPTFTIMRQYVVDGHAFRQLLHLDAYRLDGPSAVEDLGLFELLDDGAVALIEWGDIVAAAMGDNILDIRISVDEDDSREFRLLASSASWQTRIATLGEVFAPLTPAHRQSSAP
jgi:tRNA threonylcarbamoyladenosine biosynthesis protein TsaE